LLRSAACIELAAAYGALQGGEIPEFLVNLMGRAPQPQKRGNGRGETRRTGSYAWVTSYRRRRKNTRINAAATSRTWCWWTKMSTPRYREHPAVRPGRQAGRRRRRQGRSRWRRHAAATNQVVGAIQRISPHKFRHRGVRRKLSAQPSSAGNSRNSRPLASVPATSCLPKAGNCAAPRKNGGITNRMYIEK